MNQWKNKGAKLPNNKPCFIPKAPVNLSLISNKRFEIDMNYNETVIQIIKSFKSRQYDAKKRRWNMELGEYYNFVKVLKQKNINFDSLPPVCMKVFKNQLSGLPPEKSPDLLVSDQVFLEIDSEMRNSLFPFQKEGVKSMIGRKGRCLLADDMGLGKTVQSLAVASYYRDEWPLLIICPNSVKCAWYNQIEKWISEPYNTLVVQTSKDFEKNPEFQGLTKENIILINYELMSKLAQKILQVRFKVVIMDESHFIKSASSARSKACIPVAKLANHVLLLSGTPALSRPNEMFTQIDCVAPSLYNGYFKEYGNRYCDPQVNSWGINYGGSSNMAELQVLMKERILLRRLKTDVLQQLPEKRREVMILAPEFLKKASLKRHATIMMNDKVKGMERRGALLEYYHATGKVKIDAIKNYLDDLLESPKKFLFFAHHAEVLDAVENQMIKKKVGFVRIDGSISASKKQERVDLFQNSSEEEVQVAILSIVAAGTGINLTAASMAVFGELFWNPGILLQAENRCHRIGQRDFVTVYYLVAEGTADDYVWPLVEQKLEMLNKVGLNEENYKNAHTKRLEASFSEEDQFILNFFENDFFEDDTINGELVENGDSLKSSGNKKTVAVENVKASTSKNGSDMDNNSNQKSISITANTADDNDDDIDWDFDDFNDSDFNVKDDKPQNTTEDKDKMSDDQIFGTFDDHWDDLEPPAAKKRNCR